jgi:hypothetical protein
MPSAMDLPTPAPATTPGAGAPTMLPPMMGNRGFNIYVPRVADGWHRRRLMNCAQVTRRSGLTLTFRNDD